MSRFTGKAVVVTGAGGGIGRATAARLAAEGARLVLVDRVKDALADTRAAVELAMPRDRAKARCGGSRSPGRSRPAAMSSASASAMSR